MQNIYFLMNENITYTWIYFFDEKVMSLIKEKFSHEFLKKWSIFPTFCFTYLQFMINFWAESLLESWRSWTTKNSLLINKSQNIKQFCCSALFLDWHEVLEIERNVQAKPDILFSICSTNLAWRLLTQKWEKITSSLLALRGKGWRNIILINFKENFFLKKTNFYLLLISFLQALTSIMMC